MKHTVFKQLTAVFLLLCVSAVLLTGCNLGKGPSTSSPASSGDKAVTLRIAVEESFNGMSDDSLHYYLKTLQRNFSLTHEDVEIVIERIPKEEGREEVLQRLRTELMIGEGPDILVLPTLPTDNQDFIGYVEPLIPDVQLGMHNGLFLDISAYYDADTELDKAALNQAIMDAGLLGDARYVLPLCYDLPVVSVNKNAFAESGVPQDIFEYGAANLLNAIAQLEDLADVGSFSQKYDFGAPLSFNFFPQLIDYETGEVAVTAEEMESYLRAWQAYRVQLGKATDAGYHTSGSSDLQQCYGMGMGDSPYIYWGIDDFFASCESLLEAADNVLLARSHGVELDMYPLRATDGSVVADVTMYGAISSGCEHPELAYEFLRNYLSTEFQHESGCLDFFGWPVRTEGSVAPICERVGYSGLLSTAGMRIINSKNVTDEEMPILDAKIDHVRFSIPLETDFGDTVASVYDFRNKQAADVDIDLLAEEWIEKLQVHVDEG